MLLAQELRETEDERLKQSKEVIKSLAELNIMNKELRSLNHHYFEVSKKFENIFRRYMQKYGRTKISNSDLNLFNKITKEKKTVDYSAKVNTALKNPFIRFMRSNFSEIKSAELDFYTIVKQLKDKAAKSSNLGFVDALDHTSDEDGGEEDVTASRRDDNDETNNDRSESRSRSPKKESRRESTMSGNAGRSFKEDGLADKKISMPQSPREEISNPNLAKTTSQPKSVSTPKKSNNEPAESQQIVSGQQGTDAVVEKMKITRTKQSDDEDN